MSWMSPEAQVHFATRIFEDQAHLERLRASGAPDWICAGPIERIARNTAWLAQEEIPDDLEVAWMIS